jgi:hypothetical protein
MMDVLTASDCRKNEAVEGFGQLFDGHTTYTALTYPSIIGGTVKQTVLFKPLSGLFNQNTYLPSRHMPISIELELVDSATDPFISPDVSDTTPKVFDASNCSSTWSIQNVQAKCNLRALDNALDNS